MSFSTLLIHTVTIKNPTADGPNRYGDPALLYDAGTTWAARVQQLTAEERQASRDTRITTFKLFLPAAAPITALSLVEFEGITYLVEGEPWKVDGRSGLHHIEAIIERIEG